MTAKYVVFDGMDGSGKGTQLELLKERFGRKAVFTREPGGTKFAELIRELVRDNPLAGKATALTNMLLFFAAREELQHSLVGPSLRKGKHVFSDRGDSSTYAFQLFGEKQQERLGLAFEFLRRQVFSEIEGRRHPDLYVIFDLPATVARARVMKDAGREQTHFDVRGIRYYRRVRHGFHNFSLTSGQHVALIDATRSPEKVHECVMSVLKHHNVTP